MSDQALQTDQTGVTRSADGTIQPPASDQNTNPGQTTPSTDQTAKTDDNTNKSDDKGGKSLLNQGEDDKPTGAPEKYEDFKLPEGLKADPEKMATATALFKELNLSQEGAQKLVDLYAAELTAAAEAPINAWMELRKEWQKTVTNDPEIGGKLKEVRTTIARAIDTLPQALAKDFREALDLTGAGDHPAFIKAFYAFAQQRTEGRHVSGQNPSIHGQQRPGSPAGTGAAALYPHLPSAGR